MSRKEQILELIEELTVRGTGRTTRLVDQAIQDLFTKGVVLVKDHFDDRQADRYLTERIKKRLDYEHPHVKYNIKGRSDQHIIIELIK